MFLHRRFIHTWTAVPKCNENYFTTEKLLPLTKIPYFCLMYPVLGQWLMFSQSSYLSFGLPVIVKYSNINLHMQIELPKNILYNIILLAHLSTLHFYLSSSCVPICVIFRWLTYKCSGLLSHYTHLSCSSIADSYTHAQRYQNAMRIILPLKSYFHELEFPIPVLLDCFLSFVPIRFFDQL